MFRSGLLTLLATTAIAAALIPSAASQTREQTKSQPHEQTKAQPHEQTKAQPHEQTKAQPRQVQARVGEHAGFSRLVFDWPASTKYTLAQPAPGTVEIRFAAPGKIDLNAVKKSGRLLAVTENQMPGAPLTLVLSVEPGSGVKHHADGNKIVVDIADGVQGKAKAAALPARPASNPASTPAQQPTPETVEPSAGASDTAPVLAPSTTVPASSGSPVNAPPVTASASPATVNIVTMTGTELMGVAAFQRAGWLWVATDKAQVTVPPQLSGPDRAAFGPFETVPAHGGSVWRARMPQGKFALTADGGGLAWRINIAPGPGATLPKDAKTIEPQRVYGAGGDNQGGSTIWPLGDKAQTVTFVDPAAGDRLMVFTVPRAAQHVDKPYSFVEYQTLPAAAGLVVRPRVDDLSVKATAQGIELSRPGGLALSREKDVSRSVMRSGLTASPPLQAAAAPVAGENAAQPLAPSPDGGRIFDFARWTMGGLQALDDNQTLLLSAMKGKEPEEQVQDMVTMAKMNLANDRGPEALGFLTLAAETLPSVLDSPEFIALRGASEAISGKYELAFRDLQIPILAHYPELDFWRAYTLASLEDWQQAGKVLPADLSTLLAYPQPLLEKIGAKLAEVALRAGNVAQAEKILGALNAAKLPLRPWTRAAADYLTGQADLQKGAFEDARKIWTPLLASNDDLFRVRAGLALTMQELDKGVITLDQAIDRLEGLRFAWRGDELEAQINFFLGKLYMQKKQYLKALTIMRDAAGMSPDADIAADIKNTMASEFKDLLLNDASLSPLDAVSVFQEFPDLTPQGAEGNALRQKLAERMVDADLLDRASTILQQQVDKDLQGEDRARIAMRLAAVSLLNKDPAKATASLDTAEGFYKAQPESETRKKFLREIMLMRARALSLGDRKEQAIQLLSTLPPGPDVNRLRVDIAWQAQLWEDAAEALQDLILDETIEDGKPLTEYQTDLLLNRAIALNLSGNRVALGTMGQRYGGMMQQTSRGKLFDLVTRAHSANLMAEQQTISSIVSEVDMFKSFLDDYKSVTGAGENLTPVK